MGCPGPPTGSNRQGAARDSHAGVFRTDLQQQHDLGIRERVHPGEEIIYVLEGTLRCDIDGQPSITASAGEALTVPAETVHAVRNVGTGTAAELATYVVEKGKPLITLVK